MLIIVALVDFAFRALPLLRFLDGMDTALIVRSSRGICGPRCYFGSVQGNEPPLGRWLEMIAG